MEDVEGVRQLPPQQMEDVEGVRPGWHTEGWILPGVPPQEKLCVPPVPASHQCFWFQGSWCWQDVGRGLWGGRRCWGQMDPHPPRARSCLEGHFGYHCQGLDLAPWQVQDTELLGGQQPELEADVEAEEEGESSQSKEMLRHGARVCTAWAQLCHSPTALLPAQLGVMLSPGQEGVGGQAETEPSPPLLVVAVTTERGCSDAAPRKMQTVPSPLPPQTCRCSVALQRAPQPQPQPQLHGQAPSPKMLEEPSQPQSLPVPGGGEVVTTTNILTPTHTSHPPHTLALLKASCGLKVLAASGLCLSPDQKVPPWAPSASLSGLGGSELSSR